MLPTARDTRSQVLAPDELVITVVGMVSSLGYGVVQSCAAARSGLTRWAELDVDAMDDDELRSVPLQGHAIQGLTEGFAGLGRFLRLGDAALADMLEYGFDLTQNLEAPLRGTARRREGAKVPSGAGS